MINELLFFAFTLFLGITTSLIYTFNIEFLYNLFVLLFLLLNIFVNINITLFGFHSTAAEPLGVALFLIGILTYRHKHHHKQNLFTITAYSSLIIAITCFFINAFFAQNPLFTTENTLFYICSTLLAKSIFISMISLYIGIFIERISYNIFSLFFKNPLTAQTCSLLIGQLLDTCLYTFLYFNFPLNEQLQILGTAYGIKIICIIIYTLCLRILNNQNY